MSFLVYCFVALMVLGYLSCIKDVSGGTAWFYALLWPILLPLFCGALLYRAFSKKES